MLYASVEPSADRSPFVASDVVSDVYGAWRRAIFGLGTIGNFQLG